MPYWSNSKKYEQANNLFRIEILLKTKSKFFQRKREPKLEGLDKRLSNLAVIITILAGLIYIINSTYILTEYYRQYKFFRNLGAIIILGLIVSSSGVGLIVNRPPKHQIYWAFILFFILIFISYYQFYFFKK